MSEPAAWDALFVVHRLTPPARIAAVVRRHRLQRIFILSTHRFFENERASLQAALGTDTTLAFTTFAELLDDAAMAAIDDATTHALLAAPPRWGRYADHFEQQAMARKNALVQARLAARHTFARVWCDAGLGVHAMPWLQLGARRLRPPSLADRIRPSLPWRMLRTWQRQHLLPRRTASVVHDGDIPYVFVANTRRLKFHPGTTIETLPLRAALALPGAIVATTIHDHPEAALRLGRPVQVFADGYLPSNYPRTAIDDYGDVAFVSAEPFGARWFTLCDRRIAPAPSFLARPSLPPATPPARIATVVIFLGHAGDWTALINRSDNDMLAEATRQLALARPDLTFVLRAHPTMDHRRHDGPGAHERLAHWLRAVAPANLTLSTVSLAEDLARGDLFIAEYSATLLDAWRAGKLGLIANLTGRRSFMQDFADLGFAAASAVAELTVLVAAISSTPADYAARQSAAAARYNALSAPV